MDNALVALSNELANAVAEAGHSVVAVNARPRSASSGVHWRQDVIVTAEHTVKHEEDITVGLLDGSVVPATLMGRDPGTDIAVLKVANLTNPVATFGDGEVKPGALTLVIGRSKDSGVNATMGVISAVSGPWRTWRGGMMDRYIRLDATLYPGTSGGAVVDTQGQILGIATSGLSRLAGLAVPLSTVSRVVDELLTKGHISRGYLGVGLQSLTTPAGLIVLSVEQGGPAERGGLMVGDIVVALDGKPVQDTDDVQGALDAENVGKPVRASLLRGGAPKEVSITIGERPRRTA